MPKRHSVRALVVDADDHLLLYRFEAPRDGLIWVPPGGGVEPGESASTALARELDEETGLQLSGTPPHVWHQDVEDPTLLAGWDGIVNDYHLVRVEHFDPHGTLGREQLAAEQVDHFAWWSPTALLDHRGPELFSPRGLPRLFVDLLAAGPPDRPLELGW